MEGDQDQGHFQAFHLAKDPPILFPFMIENPSEHQGKGHGDQQHLRQQFLGESNQQINNHMMMAGGSDVFATPSPYRPTIQSIRSDMIQRSSYNPYDLESKHAIHGSTSEWASGRPPVKMRIIRKASTNDHEGGVAKKPRRRAQAHQADESHLQQHAMGVIRVCSDCNTSKTPLWRSGPRGPKSLCNACGIRQRKARRAMAAAAAVVAASGGAAVAASHGGVAAAGEQATSQAAKPIKKEKRDLDVDRSLPFKKRCKMVDHPTDIATKAVASCVDAALKEDDGRVSLEDVPATEGLSKPSPPATIIHDFTRDEITDAAVLLMNLSCGVVRS